MPTALDPEMFHPACPSSGAPIQIGGRWTAMVVLCLEDGPRRFSEFQMPLRRITPKVLTETLRSMERDGLVSRTAYDEMPPRVEYELTSHGRNLLGLIHDVRAWCRINLPEPYKAGTGHAS